MGYTRQVIDRETDYDFPVSFEEFVRCTPSAHFSNETVKPIEGDAGGLRVFLKYGDTIIEKEYWAANAKVLLDTVMNSRRKDKLAKVLGIQKIHDDKKEADPEGNFLDNFMGSAEHSLEENKMIRWSWTYDDGTHCDILVLPMPTARQLLMDTTTDIHNAVLEGIL